MILGIAGTLGAGKGTVVEYLVEEQGFTHFSVRNFLWEEVDRRGLPRVRDNLSIVANDLRAKHGAGYITGELLKRAQSYGADVIIESLHTLGEANFLREHGAIILGVDADVRARYERIRKRGTETDQVSFEKFVEDNEREIASNDPAKHNIRAVIDSADFTITNDGTLEELHKQIDRILSEVSR
ncbi:MAG: AAA family ATPase [bacterium]